MPSRLVSRIQTRRQSRIGLRASSIPMTFTRASEAALDGVVVGANVARYPSQSGVRGVLVEQAGSNMFTYSDPTSMSAPNFSASGIVTWQAGGVPGFTGSVVYDSTAGIRYALKAFSPAINTAYVFSCYVLMDDGGTPMPGTSGADMNIKIANVDASTFGKEYVGSNVWRIWGTLTTGGTISSSTAGVYKTSSSPTQSARTFKASGFQIEPGTVPTSYIPTVATTATRGAETLTAPTQGLPTPSTGSVKIRAYVDAYLAGTVTGTRTLFETGNPSLNRDQISLYRTGGSYGFLTSDATGASTAITWAGTVSVGWHEFVIIWGPAGNELWIDGVQRAVSAINPKTPGGLHPNMYWGSNRISTSFWNQPIAGGALYIRSLSGAEAAVPLASTAPDFTAYVRFTNGKMEVIQGHAWGAAEMTQFLDGAHAN